MTGAVELAEAGNGKAITASNGGRRYRTRLIAGPMWGSSGYYSREVLERDIPAIFPPGSHMHLDHATTTEDAERPGRSVQTLAARIASVPVWERDGMYADIEVFPHMAPVVEALWQDIGVSISASGMAEAGEAEGRTGTIVTALTAGHSVDFVTKAGAGGRIVELLEAARAAAPPPAAVPLPASAQTARPEVLTVDRADLRLAISEAVAHALTPPPVTAGAPPPVPTPDTTEESMADTQTGTPPASAAGPAEVTETATRVPVSEAAQLQRLLEESQAQTGKALTRAEIAEADRDAAIRRATLVEAKWTAETRTKAALAASPLKEASYASVIADVCNGLSLDEHGKADDALIEAAIKTAIDREQTKVADLLEQYGVGRPTGLGGSTNATQVNEAQVNDALNGLFADLGMDETTAKIAAKGR